jgi:acyl-CoA synthetase (AMP-forming)/AMP-acid ligase II
MSETTPWLDSREVAAARQAHLAPYRKAIVAPPGQCTFGELNAQANQLARALRERGLGKQSSVALICSNQYEFMVTHATCQRSGFKVTRLNWHLTGARWPKSLPIAKRKLSLPRHASVT